MIFLDTHVFVRLYAEPKAVPSAILAMLNIHDLRISPTVLLETEYFHEIKRVDRSANNIYQDLHLRLGITVDNTDFSAITQNALELSWTRDPFDRLIVAHAATLKSPLITSDGTILQHYEKAIWI